MQQDGASDGTSRSERLSGKVNTEFRLHGGRYLYEDYGVTAEAMRHFKHCTVGLYAQYSDQGKENGGFKVIMMIPPYKRKARKVMVRPASNFRLTYDIQGQPYAVKMYTTDPEEMNVKGITTATVCNGVPIGWNRTSPTRKEADHETNYNSDNRLPVLFRKRTTLARPTIYGHERTDPCTERRNG